MTLIVVSMALPAAGTRMVGIECFTLSLILFPKMLLELGDGRTLPWLAVFGTVANLSAAAMIPVWLFPRTTRRFTGGACFVLATALLVLLLVASVTPLTADIELGALNVGFFAWLLGLALCGSASWLHGQPTGSDRPTR